MPDAFVQLKSCGWADVKKKNVSLSQNKSRDASGTQGQSHS